MSRVFVSTLFFDKGIKEQIGWCMQPRGRGEPREDGCVICVILCADFISLLHDGYECSINVLYGEKITKVLFCRLLEWLVALSGKEVYYIWYQSPATKLGP